MLSAARLAIDWRPWQATDRTPPHGAPPLAATLRAPGPNDASFGGDGAWRLLGDTGRRKARVARGPPGRPELKSSGALRSCVKGTKPPRGGGTSFGRTFR